MIPALMDFVLPLALPAQIIWADQNGQRPPKPYLTLKVMQAGTAPLHEGKADLEGRVPFTEHRVLQCEIQAFGAGAVALLGRLAMRMRMPAAMLASEASGIGLGRIDPVRDITALLNDSQREDRAALEFTAMIAAQEFEQPGLIEHVVINCPAPGAGHQHIVSQPNAATPPPSS